MEATLLQIRDQQRQTWDTFSPGWKKWDTWAMNFMRPMGNAIIESLHIQPAAEVLDVATGTGEPGLTIARLATQGHVVGLDLSEGMLATARENAAQQGITNYQAVAGDVCELPFADQRFDAISCRMGFMFFPDMQLAAQEMYRVLKPGGRLATSVWASPPQNPWISTMMGTIASQMALPTPAPLAPGMFRCAQPGLLAGLLRNAGFQHVEEKTVTGLLTFATPEEYWQNMLEVAAPVVAILSKADEATRAAIKAALFAALEQQVVDGKIQLPFASLVLSAVKS
ncbi:methyltransferase domain-containing protein [Hymenobacter sp. HMF4947]|uniref:Methyltransferase domain-containing protein n=1 Tax=Hymenobacter ginkgonis TaxID=2682976 RepID=A0A7K1TJT9_9BACT|nr:methyltransferase domain-containing protein [Hymenobacter ginkgonis]MVN78665.1 methyltransferase domain-containing protein [Hymenobacter ginkgonis]